MTPLKAASPTMLQRERDPDPPAWLLDLLALGVGATMALAFAPFRLFTLAVVSLAALFALWTRSSPGRAFWRGWLFGFGLFAAGVYWVYFSMHVHGHMAAPLAALFTALFAAVLGLFPALAGYLGRRFLPCTWLCSLLVVFPGLWTLLEWVRGWIFTGFPWLNAGLSQSDAPLRGLAPLLGVYGMSWAVALTAGAFVVAVGAIGTRRAARSLAVAVAVAVLWLGAAWLDHVQWTRPAGGALKISLVQGNVPQEIKWDRRHRGEILGQYAETIRAHWGSDVIILPETAIPVFYNRMKDNYLAALGAEAKATGTELLVGMPVRDANGRDYYNSMVKVGTPASFHHKRHLVPFGEYIPLKSVFGGLFDVMRLPMANFSAGNREQPLLQVDGYPIGISICYEIAFGVEMTEFMPEARFLVNVSNNSWFGNSSAPHQVQQMAELRARELERYVVSATNDGVTSIVDHRGRVVAVLPQFQQRVLTGTVRPRQGATPYSRYGNWPVVIALFVVMGIGAVWVRKPDRRS